MIPFMPDPTNPDWLPPPVDKFYLMRHPIYVGDYLNNVVYPIECAVKNVSNRKYMVALPTKPIAQAWGNVIEQLNMSVKHAILILLVSSLLAAANFAINPYRKTPAKYAPRIMMFISIIITVQLLLITYCVNLQLGFYSFTQAGYNHLLWIIPTIISFAPIFATITYMILFYSKNFNI